MIKIKFGTDGWRAIIADDFTVENVKRVAAATLAWMEQNHSGKPIVIGYDCRFGGKLFSENTARVLAANGVKVYLSPSFVSTPMVSLATRHLNAGCGIIITASHNPPSYNGYKLKGNYGGPALPAMIDEVENLIPAHFDADLQSFEQLQGNGQIEYFDMEQLYYEHAEKSFDMEAIRKSGLTIAYDAMYGAGQKITKRLLPEAVTLHTDFNPGFNGQAPEPILKNLQPFVHLINNLGNVDFAFATDGDADRIGVFDGKGRFIDSHHIILMLVNYLHKHKGLGGEVVNSFSCTSKIGKMCDEFGLTNRVTKIGFKYICGHMIEDDVLVGGEESGGIAVKNHIPERDGVWIALTLIEYMVKSGKTLDDLINEVYSITGPFALERYDLHIEEEEKQQIIRALQQGSYTNFGPYKVEKTEDLDGYKFHLGNGSWVMIRPSGTEPVLRVYAEAHDYEEAVNILEATKETLFAKQEIA
jgi:phosphomannomutase